MKGRGTPVSAYWLGGSRRTVASALTIPRAELDRGDVTLADRSQAHHDPRVAGREVRLIRGKHDRRVSERSRLDRVFVGEVGADQLAPIACQRDRTRAGRTHPVEVCHHHSEAAIEHGVEVAVPAREQMARTVQRLADVVLRHRE
jgi:hypothetical protein